MAFEKNTIAGAYAVCVTTFFTSLGCWALLAHQNGVMAREKAAAQEKTVVTDQEFAQEAAQGGLAEIKLGQLAQNKGSTEFVKSFGQRMIVEHATVADRLKEAAAKENVILPTKLDAKEQSIYDNLSKLSGTGFDRAYAEDMVKDHQEDLAAFQSEATAGKSESIRNFALQTVPIIQAHLNQARAMLKTVAPVATGQAKK
jgi:putative membrane protein